jgi:hypothetical protein
MALKTVTETERNRDVNLHIGKLSLQTGGNQPGVYIYSGANWCFVG